MNQPHSAALSFSVSAERDIFLHWNPLEGSAPLSREEVLDALEQANFGVYELDQKALDYFLFSQQRLGRRSRQVRIARQSTPEILITLSKDELKTWLTVTPVPGETPPAREKIVQLLQAEGVVYGLIEEVLDQYESQGYLEQAVVAQGDPPQSGKSAWFEYLVEEDVVPPQPDEADRIDYRDRNKFKAVTVGQPLLRRHPPISGQQGKTVKGEILPAEEGRDYNLQASAGSVIAAEDPNLLLATREGRPIRMARSVRVDNVLTVQNVDYETGHIHFKGSVIVKGSVMDGFQIRASGDIIVWGSVEDAVLEADSKIIIQGSMFGRERARLSAGGDIQVTYIQSTEIDCMGDLYVFDGMFYCQARVLGEIHAGDNGGKGRLNGGEIWGGKRITAKIIGSNSSTTTLISLGEDPYLRQKLRDIDHNLRYYKSELEQVVKSIIYIRTRAAEKSDSLAELEERRGELLDTVNLLSEQIQEIRDNLNHSRYHCELVVQNAVMSGTRIRLAEISRPIDEDLPACRFYLEPGNEGLQVRISYL